MSKDSVIQKKELEMKVAEEFIQYFNSVNDFDYKILPNNDETREESSVDVYAQSNKGLEELKLQITTNDGPIWRDLAQLQKNERSNGIRGFIRDRDLTGRVYRAMENKFKSDGKGIFLIIFTEFGAQVDEHWASENFKRPFSDGKRAFDKVFWVKLLSPSGDVPSQVIEIK